jgi:hypothetical protein
MFFQTAWQGINICAKSVCSVLQLAGSRRMSPLVIVLTHACEALRLFPRMYWGAEHSFGHYLDISRAVLGMTLFPVNHRDDLNAGLIHAGYTMATNLKTRDFSGFQNFSTRSPRNTN